MYYFDLKKEKKDGGKRFIKISEVDTKTRIRSSILVGYEDVHDFTKLLIEAREQEYSDGDSYGTLKSKTFENTKYDFIIWDRRIHTERIHIEIKETGPPNSHLIDTRDSEIESGTYHILISMGNLQAAINELEQLIFEADGS